MKIIFSELQFIAKLPKMGWLIFLSNLHTAPLSSQADLLSYNKWKSTMRTPNSRNNFHQVPSISHIALLSLWQFKIVFRWNAWLSMKNVPVIIQFCWQIRSTGHYPKRVIKNTKHPVVSETEQIVIRKEK